MVYTYVCVYVFYKLYFLLQDNNDLILLVRLMALGFAAWDMIDSQVFKEPKLVWTACLFFF